MWAGKKRDRKKKEREGKQTLHTISWSLKFLDGPRTAAGVGEGQLLVCSTYR